MILTMNMAGDFTSTKIIFSTDARKKLFSGLEVAAEVVGCTLGPRGRTVLIQQGEGRPIATKDGATCAKSINLKDPVERMGAQLIVEAASHTNDVAGDGTTTATVLTHALVKGGMKLVEAGYNSRDVCAGIDATGRRVIDVLKRMSVSLETSSEVENVGAVSANGDRVIGKLIAEAMEKVGRHGIITVEDAKGMSTSMDVVEGMQIDRGYLSPYFVTDATKMLASYADPLVLITDKKISVLREIVPILEAVVRARKPLLIIADDVEGEALQGLILNRMKAGLEVVAIKAPGYGQHRNELLADLCVLTGAKLISSATGLSLEKATLNDLGKSKKVVADGKTTTIVSDHNKAEIEKHVADLTSQLADLALSPDEVTKLKVRIAKLASGVAVIRVGGSTEVEMIEKKHRIEDALNATKAAVEEGIVPGGGTALMIAATVVTETLDTDLHNKEWDAGRDVVLSACSAPLRRIVKNAGVSPDVVIDRLKRESNVGYNAATDTYENLIEAGVIDPVKVTRNALEHAVSVAITFLSLDAIVYEDNEETKNA